MKRLIWTIPPVLLAVCSISTAGAGQPADEKLTFERHIRPIFKAHCFDCHGSNGEPKSGLDLRLRRLMLAGGESGPAITPGDPEASPLFERIQAGEMPPDGKKLKAEEIAIIGKWITSGAATARPEPEDVAPGPVITAEEREFWSFQKLNRPAVPAFNETDRVRTPIDAFLIASMRSRGLKFSPDADKRTLLRRASLDLAGVPPSPQEIAEFMADEAPGAYERLIDRLLASPRYGQRWGRHWLDVAGYADSEGYAAADQIRSHAHPYRDYVIRAFNHDKPFDQFVQEQLAGDEMIAPPYKNLSPEAIEKLTATGYLRMAADGTGAGGVDVALASNQVMADTIKIVSTSLLGLTVGCAQCHDHRYDPILQTDYYQLRAVFEPAYDWKKWRNPVSRRISLYTAEQRARASEIETEARELTTERNAKQKTFIEVALEKELAKLEEGLRETARAAFNTPGDKRTDEQKQLLSKHPNLNITGGNLYQYNAKAADEIKGYTARINAIRARKPVEEFIRPLTEVPGQIPETFVMHRGDHQQPTDKVAPAALTISAPPGERLDIPQNDESLPSTGRRLAYARWLTSGSHPLFNRVIVNRVWMHHFGGGIVETPADFGVLGEKPSHPELLDWLATEFPRYGWSMKQLHRLMMLSTAYRQSSLRDPQMAAIDPDNVYYWRKSVRRLDAEALRDSVLAASGALNEEMFGAPIPVREDEVGQVVVGVDKKGSSNRPGDIVPMGGQEHRRSVFIQVRRSRPLALLRSFDAPVMETNCGSRTSSTVATQALMLMNSGFMLDQAGRFAHRLRAETREELREQIAHGWLLAFARPATDEELEQSLAFINSQIEHQKSQHANKPKKDKGQPDFELQALASYCQTLLNSNEFLYVD